MLGRSEQSIQHVCGLTQEKRPVEFKPYFKTLLPDNLGTHCHEWPAGKASAEGQMLVEAHSKPHDIREEGLYTKTVGFTELAKGGVWNGHPDWHTAMHSLRLQNFCGSTAVRRLESVGMNRQTDWQAQQITHLVCRGARRLEELSEHGQARASQHWSPEGRRSGERKQPTFHPPRLGMLFSTRQTLAISRARLGRLLRDGAECIWTFPSATMPSWAESETVNQEENKPWHSHYCSCCHSSP